MLTPEVQQYINQQRVAGVPDAQIRQNLVAKGWQEVDLNNVFRKKGSLKTVLILTLIFTGISLVFRVGPIVWFILAYGGIKGLLGISLNIAIPVFIFSFIVIWFFQKLFNKHRIISVLGAVIILFFGSFMISIILENFNIFGFLPNKTACPSGDPNALVSRTSYNGDTRKQSELSFAIETTNSNCVRDLLNRGGDPNARNYLGQPIIFDAANLILSDMEAGKKNVQLLLDKGADINATDRAGDSVALYEALTNRFNLVVFLIEKGADARIVDKQGFTIAGLLQQTYKSNPDPYFFDVASRKELKNLLIKQGVITN